MSDIIVSKGKYYIIGGQYNYYCYGTSDTLHGAKLIASKHLEYWDNWQGWHYPAIYRAEDVSFCGESYTPKPGAIPILSRRWSDSWSAMQM